MRWAEHVARMGVSRGVYRVLMGKPEGKREHLKDLGENVRVILKRISIKWAV
jgi:hypothetical protein